jgi:AcrR family transcriptional regulator
MTDSTDIAGPPALQNNRDVILEATRAELAQHGYETMSIRSIARRARVDPRLVRYYFPSKKTLVTAALHKCDLKGDSSMETLTEVVGRVWRDDPDSWDSFVACGLCNEPEVRDIFVGTMQSAMDTYVADDAVRLRWLLAFGQIVGGWLVTGGATADAVERQAHELLLADARRHVAELAEFGV